jgi:hypothetical protein
MGLSEARGKKAIYGKKPEVKNLRTYSPLKIVTPDQFESRVDVVH